MWTGGLPAITAWEDALLDYAPRSCRCCPGVHLVGTAARRAAVLSFVVDGVHPHDVGAVLDDEGIAVRAGHHCAQPVMRHFGVPATPGRRSPSTTPGMRSTRWHGASAGCARCSGDVEPERAVPERDPGAQSVAPELPGHARGDREAQGHNPLCGDQVTVRLRVEDGRIQDVAFQGSGARSPGRRPRS